MVEAVQYSTVQSVILTCSLLGINVSALAKWTFRGGNWGLSSEK